MNCKFCGYDGCTKAGKHKKPDGIYQKWKCGRCFRTFAGGLIEEVKP